MGRIEGSQTHVTKDLFPLGIPLKACPQCPENPLGDVKCIFLMVTKRKFMLIVSLKRNYVINLGATSFVKQCCQYNSYANRSNLIM